MSNGTEKITRTHFLASGGLANLRSSASGNSLRGIAEAAAAKAEKASALCACGDRRSDHPNDGACNLNGLGHGMPSDEPLNKCMAYRPFGDKPQKTADRMNVPRKSRKTQSAAQKQSKTVSDAQATSRVRFVIGVDPGVKTGFAVWDREQKKLTAIETVSFWELFLGIQRSLLYNTLNTCFVIEIANYAPTFRERRGKAQSVGTADRMSRNVGGLSREADLLVEGFRQLGYEVIERRPIGKAKKAADDVEQFERLTGWTERTSQHARDAGRLCYQR